MIFHGIEKMGYRFIKAFHIIYKVADLKNEKLQTVFKNLDNDCIYPIRAISGGARQVVFK